MSELIERQAAIDALDKRFDNIPMEQTAEILKLRKDLRELPTIQPEKAQLSKEGTTPAIPLTWIWKYIKWLQSLGNVSADQAGAHILAMVHKWGDEQNE